MTPKPDLSRLLQKLQDSTGQLIEEQAKADAIFASIGEGAIAIDENGLIIRINQIALDILGYKRARLLGKRFVKVLIAKDAEGKTIHPVDRPIMHAIATGKPVVAKLHYQTKKGSALPVSVTISPITSNGKPSGAIQVFRDITQELEIDRMKSEFISIASHQLRTPLTSINTYAHLLEDGYGGRLNKKQHEFMNIILSSAKHMNILIDTFLNISHIEAGSLKKNPKFVSLEQLVGEVIAEFKLLIKEKSLTLSVTIGKLPEEIFVDPLLLKEIYANLLSNAVKYTPKRGSIIVRLEQKADTIIFSINDSGHGIPDVQKDKIFSKFFRASNIVSLDTDGTGLGLYTVKELAKKLGGDISFVSQEGKGSTFYFVMPETPPET